MVTFLLFLILFFFSMLLFAAYIRGCIHACRHTHTRGPLKDGDDDDDDDALA